MPKVILKEIMAFKLKKISIFILLFSIINLFNSAIKLTPTQLI